MNLKKRLQDIIDKSVGGIVSLSRPAQADRTSFIEDQFEANLTIKDTLRLVHPTPNFSMFLDKKVQDFFMAGLKNFTIRYEVKNEFIARVATTLR